ncbi:MAG: 16S rRNA (guanine(527)-N(7))-methyltransferase RsmG [Proteobacteria bacterium]|nr:16S rRNA (guanine(527)-N(7))-methyltransferase RsmG [Pseudomonadota bacterium]
MNSLLETRLRAGVSELGLEVTDLQCVLLLEYIELLVKWNKVYNLTAVRDPADMVVRHLLDSLAIAPWCTGQRLIDVGTGAGLPGIPLAILFPHKEIHLLDSNSKKTRFLFQVKTALALDKLSIHHARVESFEPAARYDVVLSRAFASLLDMVTGCSHLLCDSGQFIAMKGAVSESELTSVDALGFLPTVHALSVPGLDEQRHLLILSGK